MTAVVQKATSTSGQFVEIYQVPATGVQFATLTLNILNRHTAEATIQVAIGTTAIPNGGSPSAADFFEDGTKIPASGGKYEYECLIAAPGERIFVKADNANCAIRLHGLLKAV